MDGIGDELSMRGRVLREGIKEETCPYEGENLCDLFCFACLICFIEGLMLVGRLEDGIHCGEFRKFGSVWMRLELY